MRARVELELREIRERSHQPESSAMEVRDRGTVQPLLGGDTCVLTDARMW